MRKKPGWRKAEVKRVRQRVSRADLLTLAYVVVATAVVTCVLGCLLWGSNRAYSNLVSPAGVRLYPAAAIWFLLAFLIGGCVAFLTCERVHANLLGPEPLVFSVEHLTAKGPMPGFLRKFYLVGVCCLSLIALANVRKHATLTETAIVDQRAMALSASRHRYSAIEKIKFSRFWVNSTKSSPGHVSQSRAVFVWFRNGERWSLHDSELHSTNERDIAELLAARSGHPVEYPDDVVGLPDPEAMARRLRYTLRALLVVSLVVLTGPFVWKKWASRADAVLPRVRRK